MLDLTERAKIAAGKSNKVPNLVLEIDGVPTIYGALKVRKEVQIGDPGLIIGTPPTEGAFLVGGLDYILDQDNAISMADTTTSIKQMMQIDIGQGGSITTLSVALLDAGEITKLITPGEVIDDILQARCKVYLGFDDVAFPQDYVVIFRGVVTDVTGDAGKVVLTINHPDDKKQGSIFANATPVLLGNINSTQTFLALDTLANMLQRVPSPDGTYDESFHSALLFDTEIIRYTSLVPTASYAATVTIATPGVFTKTAHGLLVDQQVELTTSGALPTGLVINTVYYVVNPLTNTFQLALTPGGTAINTTGTQSGVHTVLVVQGVSGCERHYLGTQADAHDNGANGSTFYRLQGNCVDLALKLLASTGDGDFYLEALEPTSFVDIDGVSVANAIYFQQTNIVSKYNVAIGDWITVTDATNGANNVSLKQIVDIVDTLTGQYIVVDGVTFVTENPTGAFVSFRSQFDTLPDGLALINDEIDIDEHLRLHDLFLSDFEYDFYLKETIDDTRKFIETEIYSPVACFSLPRKSRCSMGYHIGPLPGQNIKTFDITNIKDPSKMRLVRSTNRQFYNEIVYTFDEDTLKDQFLSGDITISELSKAQIKGYDKTLTINSKGMRSLLDGVNMAVSQSNRRLKRYQYAAEVLSFGVLFEDGFNVEIGDIVWVDGAGLQLPDTRRGLKGMLGRYFFVQNKSLNFKSGDVQLDCIDTHFLATGRYGLISPASQIASGISVTEFVIKQSYSGRYKGAEHKKWAGLIGATLRVRSADFSMLAETTLMSADTNTIQVSPALPWIPSTDMVMELCTYNDQALASAKLIYVCMKDTNFDDGKSQFVML